MRNFIIFLVWICSISTLYSQNYQWASKIGGTGNDVANHIFTDNNGFIYSVGYFAGTNIDFDPSPTGTFLLSSASGSKDGYVAKFTTSGQFVWAFKIGGSNLDEVQSVSVDNSGNVYITGYFRGSNVDFDPSPTGVFNLNSNGEAGGDPGFGGDIFVAKYNSSGQFNWAFNIGGTSLGDNGLTIVSDNAGNVYTSGYFRGNPDFDPSPAGVKNLSESTGTIYVAKYNTLGQYQWAFNMGQPSVDNATFEMKIDASANIYLTGYFQGTNIDFDPSPTGTAFLNSKGGFEIFVAKYNTNGNYNWAFSIGGSGTDVGRSIDIDNTGNVYVTGDFDGSNIDFDPSPTGTVLLTSLSRDVFVAKYNNNGQYQWAKRFGGSGGSEFGWGITQSANELFLIGTYAGTMNFNPIAPAFNLSATSGTDVFVSKFNIAGDFICAFSIGGNGNDDGYSITADNSANFYISGQFSSSSMNFNPITGNVNSLSTSGGSDIFIGKYNWPTGVVPTGTISGNSICQGQPAQLTFNATAGVGPFIIQYSNGAGTFTQNNVQTGVPFSVGNPLTTTTYTILNIRDAQLCSTPNANPGLQATVTVLSTGNLADFAFIQNPCDPKTVEFKSIDGSGPFTWAFGDGGTGSGQITSRTYSNYGTFQVKLKLQSVSGCIDSVTKSIVVALVQANQIYTNDTTICKGNPLQLLTDSGVNVFCWKPESSIQNPQVANATVIPISNTTYYFNAQNSTGPNLINNGDFTSGATGVLSDYTATISNSGTEQFAIVNNPTSWNSTLSNCVDHSSGTGNMMVVQSSNVAGKKIWNQNINIASNTNYIFSFWVQALNGGAQPSIKFSIKGQNFPGGFNVPATTCTWGKNYMVWNSGANTSVNIALTNSNIASPSYFAIDDIFFAPISAMRFDSLKVTVVDPPSIQAGRDTSYCDGKTLQLQATGGTFYSWIPAIGLNNPNIHNPITTANSSTEYIVSAYNIPGCVGRDTIIINVLPKPLISLTKDTSMCAGLSMQLNASGGNNYSWLPSTGLNANNISNPITSTLSNTKYQVTVIGSNGCSNKDSVTVLVTERPLISKRNDTTICKGSSVQLFANSNIPATFTWSPNATLNNSNIFNPIATPTDSTIYIVSASSSSGCFSKDSIKISVLNLPIINKSNDTTICSSGSANLLVSGGTNYLWFPAVGLSNSTSNNPIATPLTSTTYKVSVQGNNGCSNVDSIKVIVVSPPTINAGPDTSFCPGNSIQLNATGGTNYSWFPTAGLSNSNIGNPIVTLDSTTKFVVTSFNIPGCLGKDTITVNVLSKPIISVTKDTSICPQVPLQLNASGGNSFIWSPSSGLSGTNISNPLAVLVSNAKYFVTAIAANGCSAKDSVSIIVNSQPILIKKSDTTICNGSTVQLWANANMPASFSWSPTTGLNNPAISNPIANPINSIVYYINAVGGNGCVSKDSVSIAMLPKPNFNVGPINPNSCARDTVILTASGGGKYSWYPNLALTNTTLASIKAYPISTTKYFVIITDTVCQIVDTLSTLITVNPLPVVTISKANDIDCFHNSSQLATALGNSYQWSPAASLSSSNIANPIASPSINTTYTVKVTNSTGCSATDTITVKVSYAGNKGSFELPSAFTPNNDGKNDCFGIKSWGPVTQLKFSIFNRWGERIFYSTDPSKCWDGNYKGLPQQTGAFVYLISGNTNCGGEINKKGTVVLIR